MAGMTRGNMYFKNTFLFLGLGLPPSEADPWQVWLPTKQRESIIEVLKLKDKILQRLVNEAPKNFIPQIQARIP